MHVWVPEIFFSALYVCFCHKSSFFEPSKHLDWHHLQGYEICNTNFASTLLTRVYFFLSGFQRICSVLYYSFHLKFYTLLCLSFFFCLSSTTSSPRIKFIWNIPHHEEISQHFFLLLSFPLLFVPLNLLSLLS